MESRTTALIAAGLFAIHPANVENVVWITESKSTLALLFFLLSTIFFLRYDDKRRLPDAALCVLLFALSLLSKASTVAGPAVLLLYCFVPGFTHCGCSPG
jgi:hypothetical protein